MTVLNGLARLDKKSTARTFNMLSAQHSRREFTYFENCEIFLAKDAVQISLLSIFIVFAYKSMSYMKKKLIDVLF